MNKRYVLFLVLLVSTNVYVQSISCSSLHSPSKIEQYNNQESGIDALIESFGERAHAQNTHENRPALDKLPGWLIKLGSYLVVWYAALKEKASNLYTAAVGPSNPHDKPTKRA